MASENETIAEIVKEMRENANVWRKVNWNAAPEMEQHYSEDDIDDLADRIDDAHGREVAELKKKCEEYERQPELMAETAAAALELLKAQESKIAELREYLKANTVGVKAMHEEIETLRGMITDLRAKLKIAINTLEKISYGDGTLSDFSGLAELTLAEIRAEGEAS